MITALDDIYVETVKERFCGYVASSTLRPATMQDLDEADRLFKLGQCPCNVIRDTPGWMYDFRSCVTCGAGLGAI